MTVPNETQTIDADALRARLADAPAGLRERIAAALRARHATGDAHVATTFVPEVTPPWCASADVIGGRASTICINYDAEHDALAALAVACGLNADGSDPRDEIARLRAGLEVAQTSLAAATSGRRVTVVDEVERLQRENATLRAAYVNDLDGLRAEVRRADDERAAWRDLRDAAREYLDAQVEKHTCDGRVLAAMSAGPDHQAALDRYTAARERRDTARTRLAALVGGAR